MSVAANIKTLPETTRSTVTGAKFRVPLSDQAIALALCVGLLPVWCVNMLVGLIKLQNPLRIHRVEDALGRQVRFLQFNSGILRSSVSLLTVAAGKLAFVGATLGHTAEVPTQVRASMPPGLVSLYDIHRRIGLNDTSHTELLVEQQLRQGVVARLKIVLLGGVSYLLYGNVVCDSPAVLRIFGIKIDNVTMKDAIDWVCQPRRSGPARIGYFVNVNSVNIAADNSEFKAELATGDRVFADGSGVRLAATRAGYRLKDNVNGTDMLPLLCEKLQKSGKSLYLLGAEPGIADSTASNLRQRFPGLRVAGTQHGYFARQLNDEVIKQINASGADVLLVAFGSPLQEQWLARHRASLDVSCALAVGGLFDFYAGKVSRAPRWMRMIGFEWVWRLLQEPSRMWRRYVLGNPLFLYRTFFLKEELTQ